MVRYGEQVRGDMFLQLKLGLKRGLGATRKTYACRHTEDVGIDGHNLLLPYHGTDDALLLLPAKLPTNPY